MPKGGGNASDWTSSDMADDRANIEAQTSNTWEVEATQFISDDEGGEERAKDIRRKLGAAARRKGKAVNIKKTDGGWIITVESPRKLWT